MRSNEDLLVFVLIFSFENFFKKILSNGQKWSEDLLIKSSHESSKNLFEVFMKMSSEECLLKISKRTQEINLLNIASTMSFISLALIVRRFKEDIHVSSRESWV